jgi:hypothetical protein
MTEIVGVCTRELEIQLGMQRTQHTRPLLKAEQKIKNKMHAKKGFSQTTNHRAVARCAHLRRPQQRNQTECANRLPAKTSFD